MYDNDLTFKMIKARICHSYDVYQMDNSHDERNIHLRVLIERYRRKDFNSALTLEADLIVFLTSLQKEVDYIIGWQLDVEDYLTQRRGEEKRKL